MVSTASVTAKSNCLQHTTYLSAALFTFLTKPETALKETDGCWHTTGLASCNMVSFLEVCRPNSGSVTNLSTTQQGRYPTTAIDIMRYRKQ